MIKERRTGWSSSDIREALKIRKTDEPIGSALKRLGRKDKVDRLFQEVPKRIVSSAGVKAALKARGYHCSSDASDAVEKEIIRILDAAIHCARMNKRRTVRGSDVTGQSVPFA